jgi:hypothetical protein
MAGESPKPSQRSNFRSADIAVQDIINKRIYIKNEHFVHKTTYWAELSLCCVKFVIRGVPTTLCRRDARDGEEADAYMEPGACGAKWGVDLMN